MYRFIKAYTVGGIKIQKGVSIKPPYLLGDNCVSSGYGDILKNIPMEYLEEYTIPKKKKVKKKRAKIEKPAKSTDSNPRVSTNLEALRKKSGENETNAPKTS
jgi:hypothetical protein